MSNFASPLPGRSPQRLPRARRRLALTVPIAAATVTIAVLPSGPAIGATDPGTTPTPTPTATPTPTPNPTPPKVTTGTAEAIAGTTATLTSTVTAGGGETTVRFDYGTSNAYGLKSDAATIDGSASNATVKVPVKGLTLGTTYHFRVVATNAAGTVQGSDRTFTTTSAPKAPVVSTQAATKITGSGAQLNARVNPEGQSGTLRFDWGATTGYGNTTAAASVGSGKSTVSKGLAIGSLAPGTTYHYRAVAQNASGTVVGKDRTFTTTRGLTKVGAQLSSGEMVWNGKLTVSGTLTGAAPVGVKLELLRQDFPFNGPYRRIATTTTKAAGAYSVTLSRVFSSIRVRVRVIGSTSLVSPELNVGSQLQIRLQTGVKKAKTTRLRGTIYPAGKAAKAKLQRQSPSGKWRTVRALRLSVRSGNRMSFKTVVKRIGRNAAYRVVVDPHDGGAHVITTSGTAVVAAKK